MYHFLQITDLLFDTDLEWKKSKEASIDSL